MAATFYQLPTLSSLAAFEAAARHGSFKKAASELNVTPGAVSHQIRSLEDALGLVLFERIHRGVALTGGGDTLFRTMRGAFLDISTCIENLRGQEQRSSVTVGATTAMSALWLTPGLSGFWRAQPDIRVNQVVSDTLQFGTQNPDIVLSYGPFDQPRYTSATLFRDTLVPVCAPDLASEHAPRTLEDLARMPLIHLDAPDARWTRWHSWFSELGFSGPLRRGTTVNNYMIALQAAQDGVGMVLGWKRLVRDHLATGRLVGFDHFAIPAPTSFFVSRFEPTLHNAPATQLAEWVQARMAQPSNEMNSSKGEE